MGIRILRFTTTVGVTKDEIPFESPGTVKMQKAVAEVAKKLNLAMEAIAIAPHGGAALTSSEYRLNVDEIVERYGERFAIINKGIVG